MLYKTWLNDKDKHFPHLFVMKNSGAITFLELGTMLPQNGGQMVYLRKAFGGCLSFLSCYLLHVLLGGLRKLDLDSGIFNVKSVNISAKIKMRISPFLNYGTKTQRIYALH